MSEFKNCLVTGGAGFVGSHLVKRLLDLNYKVCVIDDLSEGTWKNLPNHPNLTKKKISILKKINPYIKGQDVIFHLAALPRLQRSVDDPITTHDVNVNGTLNLLMEARKEKIKKFIFASSSSVYGNNKIPFTEDMKVDPPVPYSLHKVIGEEYCKLFYKLWGVNCIILRLFSVYGPNMNPNGQYSLVIPKFISLIKNNKRPTIYGDGKHSRDFTYIDDVVDAFIKAANSDIEFDIFNVGSGRKVTINKLVKIISKLTLRKAKPTYLKEVPESKETLSSYKKINQKLGWKPKISIEQGLKLII